VCVCEGGGRKVINMVNGQGHSKRLVVNGQSGLKYGQQYLRNDVILVELYAQRSVAENWYDGQQ